MTESEINVAVAKACGLKVIEVPFVPNSVDMEGHFTKEARRCLYQKYPNAAGVKTVPNYAQDLNACFEMEETLTTHEMNEMAHILFDEVITHRFHSTAMQRCMAFLQVKKLRRA